MIIYVSMLNLGVRPMNEDQAKLTAIIQYILSKDVALKENIEMRKRICNSEYAIPEDVMYYYEGLLKLSFWETISYELWNLIK